MTKEEDKLFTTKVLQRVNNGLIKLKKETLMKGGGWAYLNNSGWVVVEYSDRTELIKKVK